MKSSINAQIQLLSKEMRLPTFRDYHGAIRECMASNGSYEDFLLLLLQNEYVQRKENKQVRRIRAAKFPVRKSLEEFEIRRLKQISPAVVHELGTCEFIEKKENIIMIGNPGTGKTHLSIALGMTECMQRRI